MGSHIYVDAHMSAPSATDILLTVAEPTRLRILNCLAAAPLFVSDLQDVLDLPQPTVSRHLQVLRRAELVRDTPIAQFVLYRLRRDAGVPAVIQDDADMRGERERAAQRSRSHTYGRVQEPQAIRALARSKRAT